MPSLEQTALTLAKGSSLNAQGVLEGESALMWGQFLTHTIDFIIVAFFMFLLVKGVNKFKKEEEVVVAAPTGPSDNELLSDIRDLLKK